MINQYIKICITLIAFLSSNLASANLCTKSLFQKESEAKELSFDQALNNIQAISKGSIEYLGNTIVIFESNQSKENPVSFSQALNDYITDKPSEPTYTKKKLSSEQQTLLTENIRALQKDAAVVIVDPYFGETGLKESSYYPIYETAKRIGLPGGVKHPSVTHYQARQNDLNAIKNRINKEMNRSVGIGITLGSLALFAPIEPTTAMACIAGGMCFLMKTLIDATKKTETAQHRALTALTGEMVMKTVIDGTPTVVVIMPDYLRENFRKTMPKKSSIEL